MNLLKCHCRKVYPAGFVLDVQFETDKLVTALYGPSGSGKSTVLGLIAGLIQPNSGRITIGQQTLVDTEQKRFLPPERRRVALVLQDHCLFPHMNVEQNLKYGMLRQLQNSHNDQSITMPNITYEHVLDILELRELANRSPRTLSGGQQQRVALGRALLCRPEYLLMDEPLTGLDTELKGRIISFLKKIIDEFHIPMILVSHDQQEVQALAYSVIKMENGRIIRHGGLTEVLPITRRIGDFD